MKCPVCRDSDLVMSERSGVEIDYCPSCRGVWLDRGELDKIIERSSMQSTQSSHKEQPSYQQPRGDYDSRRNEESHHQGGYYKKKKESFLADIFDF